MMVDGREASRSCYMFQVDPFICGHKGHFKTSCGLTFSHVYDSVLNGDGQYEGRYKFP